MQLLIIIVGKNTRDIISLWIGLTATEISAHYLFSICSVSLFVISETWVFFFAFLFHAHLNFVIWLTFRLWVAETRFKANRPSVSRMRNDKFLKIHFINEERDKKKIHKIKSKTNMHIFGGNSIENQCEPRPINKSLKVAPFYKLCKHSQSIIKSFSRQ